MELFERASQESRRRTELPFEVGKKIGAAALGGIALNRVAPFLSSFLPENLAIKGLSKINPKFGGFIKNAMNAGYDWEEVRDFIGEKIQTAKELAKQDKNIIQQYSPELFQFLRQKIESGESPMQAGARAIVDKKFKPIIDKIKKDHKTTWGNILINVFGREKDQSFQKIKKNQKNKSFFEEERERVDSSYGTRASSNSDADLLAAMQKILQM